MSERSSLDTDDRAHPASPVAAPAYDARAPGAGAPLPPGLGNLAVSPARRLSAPSPACGEERSSKREPRSERLMPGLLLGPPYSALAASIATAEEAAARGAALARLHGRSAATGGAGGAQSLSAADPLAGAAPHAPPSRLSFDAFAAVPPLAEEGDAGGADLSVELLGLPLRYSCDSDDNMLSPTVLRRSFSGGVMDPNPFGRTGTAPGALSALLRGTPAALPPSRLSNCSAPPPDAPPPSPEETAAAASVTAAGVAAGVAADAAAVADFDAAELCCRLSRARQTVDFVHRQRTRFCSLAKQRLSLWDALLALDEVPPVAAALASGAPRGPPVRHLAASVAAAEAALATHPGAPWLAFVALTHALGRLLLLPRFGGEPAWAVVGETFPVGARFSPAVSFSAFFAANPDRRKRAYAAPHGVYVPGAGLAEVDMAWSGDEYLLEVLARNRAALPSEGLFCVRYASFEALGQPGVSYNALMSETERATALPWLDALRAIRRQAAAAGAAPDAPDGRQRLLALEGMLRPLLDHFCPGELRW